MQDCPKCGFIQPKDRYCANCGLDIESYNPAPKPFIERLKKNILLQIGLAAVLISGLVFLIYTNHKRQLETNFELHSISMSNGDTGELATEAPTAAPRATPSRQEEPPASAIPEDPPQALRTLVEEAEETLPEQQAASRRPTALQITYTEVPRLLLMQITDVSTVLSQSTSSKTLVYPYEDDIRSLQQLDPDFDILPGSNRYNLNENTVINVDFTQIRAETTEMEGLSFQITPTRVGPDQVDLELVGYLSLTSEEELTVLNADINGRFSFAPNTTLAIVGLLPNTRISQEELAALNRTPLVILSSPDFVNQSSEFVIFIQAK